MIDLQRGGTRARRGRGGRGGSGVGHLDHIDFTDEKGKRIIIPKSKQKLIIIEKNIFSYDNNYIIKADWLSREKIFAVLTVNCLYFYYINNITIFDYKDKKELKYNKDININFENLNENFDDLNMTYNEYNSTLIISFLEYNEDTDKIILHLYILDINSLSIIKQFDIDSKFYEKYYLVLLNESTLMLLFISGIMYNISLNTNQLITVIEAFDKLDIDNNNTNNDLKINVFKFQNEKKIIIFNDFAIKLFGFNPPYEFFEENINDDKYKFLELDMFNKKEYCFNYIESLDDSGKYIIGYSQFYQFFKDKFFFKTHIKILNK